ncbi:ATP-binding protein [Sphingorhabdus sp. Alg231-15]|uniref:ATP-binding protein n=1 Tax=Sphingorhabdus sp. Alg231-15 TaxID=1922222 RepID=UPI000D55CAEE
MTFLSLIASNFKSALRLLTPVTFLAVIAILNVGPALAAPVLSLKSGENQTDLSDHMAYRLGENRTLVDMVSEYEASEFETSVPVTEQQFEPYSDLWSALTIKNVSKPDGRLADQWIVTFDAFAVRDADIFLVRQSGDVDRLLSFSSAKPYDPAILSGTQLKSKPVILRPEEAAILMVRTSKLMAAAPSLSIRDEADLVEHELRTAALNASFYTLAIFGLIVMLGTNISLKSSVGIRYALLFWLLLAALSFDDNIPLRFLYPSHPEWNPYVGFLISYACIMFGFYVAGSSMVTRKGSHPWSKHVQWFALLPIITLAMIPFIPRVTSYKIQLVWTGIMCLSHFLPLYWWEKSSNRRLFEMWAGLIIIFMAFLVYATLMFSGYLENQIVLRNFAKTTFIVIGTLVMLGLTYGIFSLRREHDRAQQEKIRVLKEDAEKSQRLLEAEKNYSRARDQAALRQRQLATASHDIRQPLSSLRMSLDAGSDNLNHETKQNIREALDYLESLSGDYLFESRPVPDEPLPNDRQVSEKPYPLSMIFQTVGQMFREEAISKGLRLDIVDSSLETALPPLVLMRMVSNLVSNAIKYTVTGKVLVGARKRESGFTIMVLDTGLGMSDEEIVRFQSVYQKGDDSSGEGLGLAICYDLAKKNGLRIEVSSTPNQGTSVSIVAGADAP